MRRHCNGSVFAATQVSTFEGAGIGAPEKGAARRIVERHHGDGGKDGVKGMARRVRGALQSN